jgi:precorrin-6A/cobalt-precorrin-6A reductase
MVRKTEAAEEDAHVFRGYEQAAAFLKDRSFSRILFTIGSNNIHFFSGLTASSYVRVLPFEKSIEKCVEAGFERSRIIAMQGPFSAEFNAALCRELEIDCLVTKNSGEGSGFREKQVACRTLGISFVVINPPE